MNIYGNELSEDVYALFGDKRTVWYDNDSIM